MATEEPNCPTCDIQERNERGNRRPEENPLTQASPRSVGSLIAGAVGGFAGSAAGDTYTRAKLYEFDGHVDNLVRNDIMNRRSGAGAGLDSAGAAMEHGLPMGGFGPGAGSHAIREAHAFNLAESGKYPFARFVRKFGSWPITLTTGLIGALTAVAAYFALAPKKAASGPVTDALRMDSSQPGTPKLHIDVSPEELAALNAKFSKDPSWKAREDGKDGMSVGRQ